MDKVWPLVVVLAALIAGMYIFWGDRSAAPQNNSEQVPAMDYPYKIVATTEIIAEVARAVAGDLATVSVLVPPGQDPRTFVLDEAALAKVSEANVILINGRGLEANFEDALRQHSGGRPLFGVADGLSSVLTAREISKGVPDPCVWLNIEVWKEAPLIVRDRLRGFDQDNEVIYDRQAGIYWGRLLALSAYSTTISVTVPERRRVMATSIDMMGYFEGATRIDCTGLVVPTYKGAQPATSPAVDAREVERVLGLLGPRAPMPVFSLYGLDNTPLDALKAAAAEKQIALVDGGALYTLVPGPPDTYTGTYVGMMDNNLTLVTLMLGGSAPSTGLNGQLPPIVVPSELVPVSASMAKLKQELEAAERKAQLVNTAS